MKTTLGLTTLLTVACSGGGGAGGAGDPASGGSSNDGGSAATASGGANTSEGSATVGATSGDGTEGSSATGAASTGAATTGATAGESTTGEGTTGQSTTATGAEGASTTTSSSMASVTSGTTGSSSGNDPLSFAEDVFPLWEMVREPAWQYRGTGSYSGCNVDGVCHGGAAPGAGLMMADAESTYGELIDVPSASSLCAGTLRVVAGDPENSCLVLFYRGRLGNDDLAWVDDAEIELMREWIRQGALP